MKINWKDPRFEGLSKKQIKLFCIAENAGKNPKVPQPQITKRVNKKIKKQEFLKSIKEISHQKSPKKPTQKNATKSIVGSVTLKRQKVMELASHSPTIYIDSAFEAKHDKKVV